MSNRFILSRVEYSEKYFILAYDVEKGKSIELLTDYSIFATDQLQLSRLTLEKRLGQLLDLWRFLSKHQIELTNLRDADLVRFRDEQLSQVLLRASSKGDTLTARRTVNDKIATIYSWLKWLLTSGRISYLWVSVPVSIGAKSTYAQHYLRKETNDLIRFRQVGSGARHRRFVATNETVELLEDRLFLGSNLYAAHRNALILCIADTVGFRRASIASLLVSQFDRAQLERETQDVVWIRPISQKFSYENSFPMPVWLALRICDFCRDYRDPLIHRKRVKEKVGRQRIFISSRDGRPLTERAITQIFSKAMRAIGAPKGEALHAIRAKFANDEIERELRYRAELGMDTSAQAVSSAVALRLGHRNPDSLYTYVVAAQSAVAIRQRATRPLLLDAE